MDHITAIVVAIIGAAAAIIAALISRGNRSRRKGKATAIAAEAMDLARSLNGLERQLMRELPKHEAGKRIESSGDRNQMAIAACRGLSDKNLACIRYADSGTAIVTLTNMGWKALAALDALEHEEPIRR